MTASTSLVPVLFLLIAYIGLRWKKTMPRSFRFGNRTFGLIAGIFLLAILSLYSLCQLCRIKINHGRNQLHVTERNR